ncbi:hypothetical protein DEO72_LG5g2688 [Vigna unguiculata]|uniref:TF-B3 domain-containing protein n=1 Tax=Vigna unguiculata TaxID=3917 RepID=A0A4D6M1F4_VIGUN|nr:hypothetical protein DEO72_LG5g2688 [Vigna unguiculata]
MWVFGGNAYSEKFRGSFRISAKTALQFRVVFTLSALVFHFYVSESEDRVPYRLPFSSACMEDKGAKRFSFNNFFQNSIMFMDRRQEFLDFDEGFFLEWADTLVIGTNFFSDPRGNVFNIEFEERLLADRKLRVFDVHWKEVRYPAVGNSGGSRKLCKLSCSPRFFQCFRLMVDTSKLFIVLPEEFRMFCQDDLKLDSKRVSSEPLNNDGNTSTGNGNHNLTKKLSQYDVESSCLYLHSNFAKQFLDKDRKRYFITNETCRRWPCRIRWTGRTCYECYITCGWKRFCKDNLLVAGDIIQFAMDTEKKNVIHVVKV